MWNWCIFLKKNNWLMWSTKKTKQKPPEQKTSSSFPLQSGVPSHTLCWEIHIWLMWHKNWPGPQFALEWPGTWQLSLLYCRQVMYRLQIQLSGTHRLTLVLIKHSFILYFSQGQLSSSDPWGQSVLPLQCQNIGMHFPLSSAHLC